jgi:hypothetical protein
MVVYSRNSHDLIGNLVFDSDSYSSSGLRPIRSAIEDTSLAEIGVYGRAEGMASSLLPMFVGDRCSIF